jgi:hypothetical protein
MNPRVTVQSDNRIVFSGLSATCDSGGEEIEQCDRITCGDTVTCTAVLLRYEPSGALDQGFGSPGSPGQTRLISDFDSRVVARQPGGDFTVFIGREIDAGSHRPVVAATRQRHRVGATPAARGKVCRFRRLVPDGRSVTANRILWYDFPLKRGQW